MSEITIYCDGSCNNATKDRGGYGIYIDDGVTIKTYSGGQYVETNSARMELLGALMALKKVERTGQIINIYIDNQYVVHSFTKKWIFRWEQEKWRARKNSDILKQLLFQYRRLNNKVRFHWVRGHDIDQINEICDVLAKLGGRREKIIKDVLQF